MRPCCLFATLVCGMQALSEPQSEPGPEVLREQLSWGQYTIRILGPSDFPWQSRIEFHKQGQTVYEQSEEGGLTFLKRSPMVCTIDAEAGEVLVLELYTGGAHCCVVYLLFSLGDPPSELARLDTRDAGAKLKDEDDDGITEFHTADMAFAYFGAPYVSSVRVPIVVWYQDGAFQLAEHFMRKPAPSDGDWQRRLDEVQADWHDEEVINMTFVDEKWGNAPPSLWANMLEFIYSGHGALAWKFLDEAWPETQEGKHFFRKDFEEQLSTSDYYDDVLRLNGWGATLE